MYAECKACDFNPHSHKGSDVKDVVEALETPISIHTPTRGVTDNANSDLPVMRFQSTLPQGE